VCFIDIEEQYKTTILKIIGRKRKEEKKSNYTHSIRLRHQCRYHSTLASRMEWDINSATPLHLTTVVEMKHICSTHPAFPPI
jgi:hypothetical protein